MKAEARRAAAGGPFDFKSGDAAADRLGADAAAERRGTAVHRCGVAVAAAAYAVCGAPAVGTCRKWLVAARAASGTHAAAVGADRALTTRTAVPVAGADAGRGRQLRGEECNGPDTGPRPSPRPSPRPDPGPHLRPCPSPSPLTPNPTPTLALTLALTLAHVVPPCPQPGQECNDGQGGLLATLRGRDSTVTAAPGHASG